MTDSTEKLNHILDAFNIKATCVGFQKRNNFSTFDIRLNSGERVKTLEKFSQEIALNLKSYSKPFIKTILEQGIVRLEFYDSHAEIINLLDKTKTIQKLEEKEFYLGNTIDDKPLIMNLLDNPHLLISGTTGSGKSNLLHAIIFNALHKKNMKIFLVDTKRMEFERYASQEQVDVSFDLDRSFSVLEFIFEQMEWRYETLAKNKNTKFSPIIFIIDEFADIIAQDEDKTWMKMLSRIVQKSRAANIYFIIATQRPSVNVVNGLVKANFPARIACKVASSMDSRIAMGISGAECLAGKGDSIIVNNKLDYIRFQAAYCE